MATSVSFDIFARDRASDTFSKVGKSADGLGAKFKKFGKAAAAGAAVAGGAAIAFGVSAVKAASDAQQSLGGTQAVFGKFADTVISNSNKAAEQFGLSANQYRESANLIGSLLKNQGVSMDELAGKTQNMVALGSDLAATYGGTTKDAVEALSSAFKGEFDPLERYGISLKQSTVSAEAWKVAGVDSQKAFNALSVTQQKAAQRQATTNLLMKQSKDAQGQFGKQTNTLAEQQQILGAKFDNLKVALGNKFLPVVTKVFTFLSDKALPAVQELGTWLGDHLGPVIEKVRGIFSSNADGINKDVTSKFASIKSTIQSFVSIVTSLWQRFGGFLTTYALATFKNLWTVIGGALKVIQGVFKVFASLLKGDWKGVWQSIKLILSGALTVIRGLLSQALNLWRLMFKVAWSAIKGIVGGAWSGIKSLVAHGASSVLDVIKALPGKIKALGGVFKDAGHWVITQMVNGLKGAAGLVSDISGNVWNAVKKLLNSGIDKINSALEFKISLPGPDIHVNPPNIPHLAKGGIVTRPTVALIGEAGPEAVVPLSGRNAPRGGGGNVYITVSGALDPNATARQIEQMLTRLKRTNGGKGLEFI